MVYSKMEKSPLINVDDIMIDTNGTIVYEDGTYTGEIKNGKRHGKGVMIYNKNAVDKNATCECEWKENKRHGKGKITYENGNIYEGDWKDDKRNGDGTLTYCNNSPFFRIKSTFGTWKNDKFEERKKTWFESGEIYEGNFDWLR